MLCSLFSNRLSPTKKTPPLLNVQPVQKTVKCILDKNRPCDSRSRKPNRYTKTELVDFWNTNCKTLSNEKPKTIDGYCKAIQNVTKQPSKKPNGHGEKKKGTQAPVQSKQTLPVIQVQHLSALEENSKAKILRFLKRYRLKKKIEKIDFNDLNSDLNFSVFNVKIMNDKFFRVAPTNITPELKDLLQNFEQNKFTTKEEKLSLIVEGCYEDEDRFRLYIDNWERELKNPKSLVDRNITIRDIKKLVAWSEQQKAYLQSLSTLDKMSVFCYTYGGDKIVNSLLRGDSPDPKEIIPNLVYNRTSAPYVRYVSKCVFPLAPFLYHDIIESKDVETFCSLYDWIPDHFAELMTELYKKVKGSRFSECYFDIFMFFVDNKHRLPALMLYSLVETFKNTLEKVVRNAPKTPLQFWVYRGIDQNDYVVVGDKKRYVFKNDLFMSTTLNLCHAGTFKNEYNNCCIQQILVPKGISCLMVLLLSFFPEEIEILFPPGAHLYPISPDFIASNTDTMTRKFLIAN